MRPLGRPPMPRAISNPNEPVDVEPISWIGLSPPNLIIDPLPNWRSIWAKALSRAFCFSTFFLSVIDKRSAICEFVLLISQQSTFGNRMFVLLLFSFIGLKLEHFKKNFIKIILSYKV